MFTKRKRHFTTLLMALMLLVPAAGAFATPVAVYADSASTKAACEGIGVAGGSCTDNGTFGNLIADIVNVLSMIVGAVAVIMIIIAGFKYVTSAGDASKASSAKNTLVYAIIGIVIVVLAQVLVHFVINKANQATSGLLFTPVHGIK